MLKMKEMARTVTILKGSFRVSWKRIATLSSWTSHKTICSATRSQTDQRTSPHNCWSTRRGRKIVDTKSRRSLSLWLDKALSLVRTNHRCAKAESTNRRWACWTRTKWRRLARVYRASTLVAARNRTVHSTPACARGPRRQASGRKPSQTFIILRRCAGRILWRAW